MLRLLLERPGPPRNPPVDQVTRPAVNIPACRYKTCGAREGDRRCYTTTGWARHMHAIRVQDITAAANTTTVPAAAPEQNPAGHLTGRRPSDKQAGILAQAANDDNGQYELSGYGFHGEAQRRAAVSAMTDPARGWLRHVRETRHGTLYQITTPGRAALTRYTTWMSGGKPK
jgi:hypothetical protein